MYVIVLYLLMGGVFVEAGYRAENGVDVDKFTTLAECQAQVKKDMAGPLVGHEDKAKLVCEKR